MPSFTKIVMLMATAVAALPLNSNSTPIATVTATTSCGTPTLPVQGATTTLPAPTGVSLVYVALGRGVQNYTCSAVGATPVALGAVATLYDATSIAGCSTTNDLPAVAVYSELPTSTTAKFEGLSVLGHHFFDAAGTPTFDLSTVSKILYAGKTADITAPLDASPGPNNTGAVDWLQLQAKSTYTSVGLSEVYRVETAGGNPTTTCAISGVLSVPYSALYFFYD